MLVAHFLMHTPQKEHCRYMLRREISMNEALALIFNDTLEGDQGEFSDEDQPCSDDEFKEQDPDVDNDNSSSPKQCLLATESSDSLPTDFSTPIIQHIQPNPDVLDSSDIATTAFEVSIAADPVSVVSDFE